MRQVAFSILIVIFISVIIIVILQLQHMDSTPYDIIDLCNGIDKSYPITDKPILFLTYSHISNVPLSVLQRFRDFAGSDYQIIFYNDEECMDALEAGSFPEAAGHFQALHQGAHKADLFRYCMLFDYGGLYLDIDLVPLKSNISDIFVLPITKVYTSLSAIPNTIFQAVLAAPKGAPVMRKLAENVLQSNSNPDYLMYTRAAYSIISAELYPIIPHLGDHDEIYLFEEYEKDTNVFAVKDLESDIFLSRDPHYGAFGIGWF